MEKKFVTLFPECGNYGIVKDVGMIPYTIGQIDGWSGELVSCQIDAKGEYLSEFTDYLYTKIAGRFNAIWAGIIYLMKNSKTISVLNLYHFKRRNIIWMWIYKHLNPEGKTYIKMDMGFEALELYKKDKKIRRRIIKMFELSDVISIESTMFIDEMKAMFNREFVYIPNGFYPYKEKSREIEKENLIFTAGRLGTEQKATEVLLEAFQETCDLHNYNLCLAGSINGNLDKYLNIFFEKYPKMSERITFLGEIKNRQLMMEYYEKAKIFILTSRWEGFPLVIPEAMSHGCYLLLTDKIAPAKDVIESEDIGMIMKTDDVENIALCIRKAIDKCNSDVNYEYIKKMSRKYEWERICKKLVDKIENV